MQGGSQTRQGIEQGGRHLRRPLPVITLTDGGFELRQCGERIPSQHLFHDK
jgi:hypothetical protein